MKKTESPPETTPQGAHPPRPYWNPYWAGVALGLVLLATFVIMGRGLGASGAFSSLVAAAMHAIAPAHAEHNAFYAHYLGDGSVSPLKDWLVFEVLGVFVGGLMSGALANRARLTTEKGPRISHGKRFFFAFLGGMLMAVGAKLGLGCTSGQALTGGSLLDVGSWAYMFSVFGGGYAMAYFMRRQWT